ncbi:proline-rich protein 29 [Etheostoma spectabile]|uniref:proline-rich protein 29 n=1 Tax=Etheostoma spectabile TaxID=54343 RepID=UPI0013AFAC61|nr:proline-rich protein 29-like [Etheostoma spectabile]
MKLRNRNSILHLTQAPQQPTTILQQLPATMVPPGSAPSIKPGGHVKEDLVELMMIQNAQMHQVIMNNMTMSAKSKIKLSCFSSCLRLAPRDLVIIQENKADPEMCHHFYQSTPCMSYPAWFRPQATLVNQDPIKPPSSPPHRDRTPACSSWDCRSRRYACSSYEHPHSNTQQ